MSIYKHRFVAQIVLEATTPLKSGSGESSLFIDSPVIKDWNGLPMILGSSIAGILRKSFDGDVDDIFGKDNGSRVLISNAHLLDENQEIHYSLGIKNRSEFLEKYSNLPIREHTAITDKGVTKEHSKFNEEIVYKGSRFKFEIEFLGDESDEKSWQKILNILVSPTFRLGSGSTKGFGEMKVVSCLESTYILGKNYQNKPSDLNKKVGKEREPENTTNNCVYKITIKPDDFFSFGAGFGDDEVDDIFVTEEIVKWKDNTKGKFSKRQLLLPASSLKGALSHRVAYHYNRLKGVYADKIELSEFQKHIGENNEAVYTIFGASKGHENESKGKALFSDVYKELNESEVKIFDHVKIDRFTGGAIDSALFNEKVNAQRDEWKIEIVLVENLKDDIKKAFESALNDLCNGLLPLGGKVNRGHGVFIGNWNEEGCNDKK